MSDVIVPDDGFAFTYHTYQQQDTVLTTFGDHTIHFNTAYGCDSTINLHLAVRPLYHHIDSLTICDNALPYQYGDSLLTQAGEYMVDFGNDSVVLVALSVAQTSQSQMADTICQGTDYYFGNDVLTMAGSYYDTLTNAAGCDSTVTLSLTVNATSSSSSEVTICEGTDYLFGGDSLTNSGTYYDTLVNSVGCDSVATLTLTVNAKSSASIEASVCEGNSFAFGEVELTESGIYYDTLANAAGCDSVTALTLTINQGSTGDTTVVVCDNFTWYDTTYIETPEVAPTKVFTNAAGCDSVVTLTLTINASSTGDTAAVACDNFTWYGIAYAETPEVAPTKVFTNAAGCDSTVTLHLTINNSSTSDTAAVACDNFTWHGETYAESGSYTYTTENAAGCDSLVTLNLTINASNTGDTTAVACDSFTWYGIAYSETPEVAPTKVFTNAVGCDSTVTLYLTINNSNTGDTTVVACDSYTWIDGETYTESNNIATSTLENAAGCDSVVTLNLTVNYSVTEDVTLSDSNSVVFNGETFTEDTAFTLNLQTVNGCDSTVNVTITVLRDTVVPEPQHVLVSVSAGTPVHGSISALPSSFGFYYVGDTIHLSATPDSGYHFEYWKVSYMGDSPTIQDTIMDIAFDYVVDSSDVVYDLIAIQAFFASDNNVEDSLTVNLFTADATMGTTVPAPGTYRLAQGESMYLTYEAYEGYHFDHWEGVDHLGDDDFEHVHTADTIIITANLYNLLYTIDMVAYFAPDSVPEVDTTVYYYVSLLTADATMGTVSVGDSVEADSLFTATATAFAGCHFVAWTMDGNVVSTANPYTFAVTSDMTLTATFDYDEVTAVLSVNDATMGTTNPQPGTYTFHVDDTACVTAISFAGHRFAGWVVDGTPTGGSDSVVAIAVTAGMAGQTFTVEALFEAVTGIGDIDADAFVVTTEGMVITVKGAEGRDISVYDAVGRRLHHTATASTVADFPVGATGVYLVKVGSAPARCVVIAR